MLGPDLLSVYSYINNIIKNTNIHAGTWPSNFSATKPSLEREKVRVGFESTGPVGPDFT